MIEPGVKPRIDQSESLSSSPGSILHPGWVLSRDIWRSLRNLVVDVFGAKQDLLGPQVFLPSEIKCMVELLCHHSPGLWVPNWCWRTATQIIRDFSQELTTVDGAVYIQPGFCWVLKTWVVRIDTGIFSNFICPWNSKVYNHFKILADGARDKDSFVGISKHYRISGTLWNLTLSKWGLLRTSDRPQHMPSPL